MDVVIAGGHGRIALVTERLLADRGDRVRALIRNPVHVADVEAAGAEPVVADLEALTPEQLAELVRGAEAIVYAAGAGPGSGPERKWSMDYGGAAKLIQVARRASIDRYVMVSAAGADADAEDDGAFGTYLKAKGRADAELEASGLAYTIIRPVGLTDDPSTDAVSTDPERGSRQVTRADVAATIAAVLADPGAAGLNFVLRAGSQTIVAAIESLHDAR